MNGKKSKYDFILSIFFLALLGTEHLLTRNWGKLMRALMKAEISDHKEKIEKASHYLRTVKNSGSLNSICEVLE